MILVTKSLSARTTYTDPANNEEVTREARITPGTPSVAITSGGEGSSIAENSNVNEAGTVYTATAEASGAVTWSLEGADAQYFEIDDAGVVTFKQDGRSFNYEATSSLSFTVKASLTHQGSTSASKQVTIPITNVDEQDASVSISHAGSVASLEIGSVLTATVTPDVDAPDGEYAIVWVTGDGSAATGASYTLQDSDIGEELIARTTYTDPANNEEVTREARITPGTPSVAITSGGEGSSIAENSNVNEAGTVYTATAEASGAVTWSLEGADAQYFEIDDAGVVTFKQDGRSFNYEATSSLSFTVKASLTHQGSTSASKQVTIPITNVDEQDASVSISHAGSVASLEIGSVLTATVTPDVDAPDGEYAIVWVTGDGSAATGASYTLQDSDIGEELIARTTYTDPANNEEVTREARITPGTPSVAITSGGEGSSIAENSNVNEAGTVYTATAEASGAVTWSLEGADAQYFEIDDAGVVTFKQDGRSFNYEATSSLSFTVKASLTHQGSTSASKQVTIPITNVDEQDASVSISHAGSVASLEIGSVLTATVTPDVDAPDGEYAIVWVTGDGSAATGASYTLQDSDIGEELIARTTYTDPANNEEVTREARITPGTPSVAITSGGEGSSIAENSNVNEAGTVYTATAEASGAVTWSLEGADAQYFEIDDAGVVTFKQDGRSFNYEATSSLSFTVKASLTHQGSTSASKQVTIPITNVDEQDASVSISHAGSVASLEIGSVLTATVTPDVDAPDGEYAIVWVTGDGSAATGASYTLQDSDIGEELIARTTYTDPANNEEVTREARITPGTPSVAITSGGEGSSIAENSNVNEAGTVYTATAEASGAVTWSLEGADAQYFEIDDAGVVTFKQDGRSFNYEATSSLSFTVKASLTHQGSTSASKQVTIPITNVDEQDASVSISHAGSVASLEIGSVLTATVTPDVDAPDGEYAIVWVTGDGSAATGASYTLQDSDIGEELIARTTYTDPANNEEVTREARITPGTPSVAITSGGEGSSIAENSNVNEAGTVYTATAEASGAVTWSLEGADAQYFEIDDAGVVTFKQDGRSFNYEATSSLSFTVKASLTHQGSTSASKQVTIPITNVDEQDASVSISHAGSVASLEIGSVLTATVTPDVDAPDGEYAIVWVTGDGSAATGASYTLQDSDIGEELIARTTYTDPANNEEVTREARITPGTVSPPDPPPSSSDAELSLRVIDDSILEGTTYKRTIAVLSLDGKGSGWSRIDISGDTYGIFEVVHNKLQLKRGVVLDYETEAHRKHSITLTAVDSDNRTLASKDFTLSVTDRAWEPIYVRLTSSEGLAELPEHQDIGGTLVYTPAYESNKGSQYFSIHYTYTDDLGQLLRINGNRASDHAPFYLSGGNIFAQDDFVTDYEHKSSYSFLVRVYHDYNGVGTGIVLYAAQEITIRVKDGDDPIEITSGDRGSRVLVDNQQFGSAPVYTATANSHGNGSFIWSLEGIDRSRFSIDSNGVVTPRKSLNYVNYEKDTSYSFTVVATVRSDLTLQARRDVTIEIQDVDEEAAGLFVRFTSDDTNIVIRENEPLGDRILHTFTAESESGAVHPTTATTNVHQGWQLPYDRSHIFSIIDGELRFRQYDFVADYEIKDSYTLLVRVEHPHDDLISAYKWVTINVENDPSDDVTAETIETNATELSIYENHPVHKDVLYNLGDLRPETRGFALTEGYKDNALFKITDDGRIWWNATPDYENPQDQGANNLYQIKVAKGDAVHHFAITVEDIRIEKADVTERPRTVINPETSKAETTSQYTNTVQKGQKVLYFNDLLLPEELPRFEIQEILLGWVWQRSEPDGPLTITWSLDLTNRYFHDLRGKVLLTADNQATVDSVRTSIERAFEKIEAAANLKFIEVMDNENGKNGYGDIAFKILYDPERTGGVDDPGSHSGSGGFVSIKLETPSSTFNLNSKVTLHEIGHALGLGHPFEVGRNLLGDPDKRYSTETIMSYNSGMRYIDDIPLYPLDIAALQYLYGAPGDDDGGVELLYLL